ncbi:MAG: hypothetical protein IPK07_29110 [Deltaproteobacteria bacterium]|nr:hypothetical protein [Deltaproteobacteria bacterium]
MSARSVTGRRSAKAWGLVPLLLLAAWVALEPLAPANSFETIGVGPRSSAMLGATAATGDATSTFYNPAGLTRGTDTEISLNFTYTDVNLEINGENIDDQPITGSTLGVLYPTEFFGQKVAIGALVYVPAQRAARLLTLPLDQPQFLYYGTRNQRLVVMAGGALEITPWLSVGGGIQSLLDTSSEPDFTLIQDPDPSNDDTDPGADADEPELRLRERGAGPGAVAHLRHPGDTERAASLRRHLPRRDQGPPRGAVSRHDPGDRAPRAHAREDPLRVAQRRRALLQPADGLGGRRLHRRAIHARPRRELVRLLAVPGHVLRRHAHLRGRSRRDHPAGAGLLPIAPPAQDIIVPSVGAEWQAFADDHYEVALRGGYAYRSAMLKVDRGLTNFLDTTTHVIGLGFGVTIHDWTRFLKKPLTIDGYTQIHVLEDRNIVKDDPASSPYGDLVIGGLGVGGGLQATVRF